MSSLGINFSGLASGLDTRSIIDALLAVEQRPIRAMEIRQGDYRKRRDLFGDLNQLLGKLQDKADALRKATTFLERKVSLDDEDHLTATASSSATPGSYDIEVLDLAAAQVSSSNGRADKDVTGHGIGTLTITVGTTEHYVVVGDSSNTLEGIANAINGAGIGVQAQVIDTGAPTDPFKLVLTGTETGADNLFSIGVDEGDATLTAFAAEINGNIDAQAADAHIKLNGIDVFRNDNSISDVITGVTLNLKGIHAAQDKTRLTISTDAEKTAEKVEEFVEAYNAIIDFVEGQSEVDEEGQARNPLFGDSTLRGLRSTLRRIVGTSVSSGNQSYTLLAQVGVESDTAGKLSFTRSEFEEAVVNDPDSVRALFAKDGAGIASLLHGQIDVYTDEVDGQLKTRRDGFDTLIRDLDDRIASSERRLESYERQLINRFAAMEALLSRLQGQGSSLSVFNPPTSS